MAETPTTKLEAVNIMLRAIGVAPINSLSDTVNADVASAVNILQEISREVQGLGWDFNTDTSVPMVVDDETGTIPIPDNVIRFDGTEGENGSMDLVERGRKVYDRANRTYTFSRSIKADLVLFLPFEDLPEAARRYISLRSARTFVASTIGSTELDGFTEKDELKAKILFEEAHSDTADLTIFKNYGVSRVLDRYHR